MVKDIFNPGTETREDRARRLELVTIARMLCTRPNERRAIRLDIPEAIYLIEARKTCDPLAIVGFQLISRDYSPEKDAPAFLALINLIRSVAGKHNVPPIYLCAWNESHWGFAKIPPDETLQHAPNNDSIVLIPQKYFLAIYVTNREKSIKITV